MNDERNPFSNVTMPLSLVASPEGQAKTFPLPAAVDANAVEGGPRTISDERNPAPPPLAALLPLLH